MIFHLHCHFIFFLSVHDHHLKSSLQPHRTTALSSVYGRNKNMFTGEKRQCSKCTLCSNLCAHTDAKSGSAVVSDNWGTKESMVGALFRPSPCESSYVGAPRFEITFQFFKLVFRKIFKRFLDFFRKLLFLKIKSLIHISWDRIDSFFEIAASSMSDIRFNRSEFPVKDLDAYYHLKVLVVLFC